jgi:proline dehydrogenase
MMRKYNKDQLCSIYNCIVGIVWIFEKSCMKWQEGRVYYWNEVSSWRLHGKEHARAKKKGINNTNLCIKEATDANYDATVDYMIDHLDGMAIFLVLIMKKVLII